MYGVFPYRVDEEGLAKTTFQKQLREMQNQMQEVLEDLETERESRNKAEKQKRDLNEVMFSIENNIRGRLITCQPIYALNSLEWSISNRRDV